MVALNFLKLSQRPLAIVIALGTLLLAVSCIDRTEDPSVVASRILGPTADPAIQVISGSWVRRRVPEAHPRGFLDMRMDEKTWLRVQADHSLVRATIAAPNLIQWPEKLAPVNLIGSEIFRDNYLVWIHEKESMRIVAIPDTHFPSAAGLSQFHQFPSTTR